MPCKDADSRIPNMQDALARLKHCQPQVILEIQYLQLTQETLGKVNNAHNLSFYV